MEKQFIFTHGYLINRRNINCAQLLSGGTINHVNVTFRDGVTITIKGEDEKDAIKTLTLLQYGELVENSEILALGSQPSIAA